VVYTAEACVSPDRLVTGQLWSVGTLADSVEDVDDATPGGRDSCDLRLFGTMQGVGYAIRSEHAPVP